jgi:hypothetical protein
VPGGTQIRVFGAAINHGILCHRKQA